MSQTAQLLDQLRNSYLEALPGKLEDIELLILSLENHNSSHENFAQLFRAVHSLKGSGGTFGAHVISAICHQFEDQLSNLSQSGIPIQSKVIDRLLAYLDLLQKACVNYQQNKHDFTSIEQALAALKSADNPHMVSVLLIEPSATYQQLLVEALADMPVRLSWVKDGANALERLLNEKFDILITANETATYNGYAVIAANKLNKGINRNISTILLTSNDQAQKKYPYPPDVIIPRDSKLTTNLQALIKSKAA